MRKRHQRTLDAIFAKPVSGNIRWKDIESLNRPGFAGDSIS